MHFAEVGFNIVCSGIAGEFAKAGHTVHCFDTNADMFPKSKATIIDNLSTLVKGGVLKAEEIDKIIQSINPKCWCCEWHLISYICTLPHRYC